MYMKNSTSMDVRRGVSPCPPCAPHRLAPEGPGYQRNQRADGAGDRGTAREEGGNGVPPDQIGEARNRHDGVGGERCPGRGHVDVHDPHRVALLIVGRCQKEAPDRADRSEDHEDGKGNRHGEARDPQEAVRRGEAMEI